MGKIYNRFPYPIKDVLLRIKGNYKYKNGKVLKSKICNLYSKYEGQNREKDNLLDLLKYGSVFEDFIIHYFQVDVVCHKTATATVNDAEPTVICVVKNDLMRMQLFLEHYRNLGVKHFAILDDDSDDGTREYLLSQGDVNVYVSNCGYTTIIRQVWINKIINLEGINKWYVIVDSDELLVYKNCETITLKSIIAAMQKERKYVGEALMLDMLSANGVFDNTVKKYSDIPLVYKYFVNNYYRDDSLFAPRIKGGFRAAMFGKEEAQSGISTPVVSKYPIVYVQNEVILVNSHYCFPLGLNYKAKLQFGLLHYKFLPGDQKKYEERLQKKNFGDGSAQYKVYTSTSLIINELNNLIKYEDSRSLNTIELIEKL